MTQAGSLEQTEGTGTMTAGTAADKQIDSILASVPNGITGIALTNEDVDTWHLDFRQRNIYGEIDSPAVVDLGTADCAEATTIFFAVCKRIGAVEVVTHSANSDERLAEIPAQ